MMPSAPINSGWRAALASPPVVTASWRPGQRRRPPGEINEYGGSALGIRRARPDRSALVGERQPLGPPRLPAVIP